MSCSVAVPECVILGVLSGMSDLHFTFTSAYVTGSPGGTKRAEITRRVHVIIVLLHSIPNK